MKGENGHDLCSYIVVCSKTDRTLSVPSAGLEGVAEEGVHEEFHIAAFHKL